MMRKIELLSPARDADVGIEAFKHGADAVYIGAPRFSARAAVGNSAQDIERLTAFGHRFGAKTFIALNTIMNDDELREAERMAWQLYEAGADALIVQDLGLLSMHLPPIELHASTQMDNRTPEKVKLLGQMGFKRVVVARELSISDIQKISAAAPDVELECFVHGALCVSVSGQCYLSAALTGRSANRGECAQPCRLPMDLVDATGRTLIKQKHLLSLKDMNRSDALEDMILAGVTSLKIEGRLKDVAYVKNVTAFYRKRIDALLSQHSDWSSVSEGRCVYTFEPRPAASFNRGFTPYLIYGDERGACTAREGIANIDSPKSIGEPIGEVQAVGNSWFTLRSSIVKSPDDNSSILPIELHNGDGLLVKDLSGNYFGFRLNKCELNTKRLYPANPNSVISQLRPKMQVFRNSDYCFEQLLQKPTADRRIEVEMSLQVSENTILLQMNDLNGLSVEVRQEGVFETARTPQGENIRKQLQKLGDTYYVLKNLELKTSVLNSTQHSSSESAVADYFIPSSVLADLRRQAVAKLDAARMDSYMSQRSAYQAPDWKSLISRLDASQVLPQNYLANVMNSQAEELLHQMNIPSVSPAFECSNLSDVPVMFTRHCLKFALGCCPKYQQPKMKLNEPLSLKIGNRFFVLKFGCKNDCMSEIFSTFATQNPTKKK